MEPITVLIADDDALFREGLVLLLGLHDDIRFVGEAADGAEAIRAAEALRPDILLLDVNMPGMSGLEALPRICGRSPGTKVLILSGYSGDRFVAEALERGAAGYLLKSARSGDLVRAIRTAHAEGICAEPRVLAEVLDGLRRKLNGNGALAAAARERLTDREMEVATLAAEGMTNKEIAQKLGVSEKTVKTHLASIFNKLGIARRLHLAHVLPAQP